MFIPITTVAINAPGLTSHLSRLGTPIWLAAPQKWHCTCQTSVSSTNGSRYRHENLLLNNLNETMLKRKMGSERNNLKPEYRGETKNPRLKVDYRRAYFSGDTPPRLFDNRRTRPINLTNGNPKDDNIYYFDICIYIYIP